MKISVVITSYHRAPLLDNTLASIYSQAFRPFEVIVVDDGNDYGATEKVCATYGATYYKRQHRPAIHYSNPAIPNNIGIRMAKGEVIILQNAECKHVSPEVMQNFYEEVNDNNAVFALVEDMDWMGGRRSWYVHPTENPRPFFFCGAMKKKWFEELRGFDEDYIGYGYDDNDFADRLITAGVKLEYSPRILAQHQYHESTFKADEWFEYNKNLYVKKSHDMRIGAIGYERNLGREWGVDSPLTRT